MNKIEHELAELKRIVEHNAGEQHQRNEEFKRKLEALGMVFEAGKQHVYQPEKVGDHSR